MRTEVCVDSSAGARAAAQGGADRIALCSAPELGGITASAGLLEAVVDVIPTHVLIRPRAGNFRYDRYEIRVMAKDIEHAIDRGAESVSFGVLTDDGRIDVEAVVRLLGAAGEVPVTFHRAFDRVRDPLPALDDLMELGVDRLLTAGGRATAVDGAGSIAEFVRRCGDDLLVMPGGGITPENASALVQSTGVREIHFSARSPRPAAADHPGPTDAPPGNPRLETDPPRFETDVLRVRAIVEAVETVEDWSQAGDAPTGDGLAGDGQAGDPQAPGST